MECKIYKFGELKDYKYADVFAWYKGKWIFCKHKMRDTWEFPGGHIEECETPLEAAKRELFEESGAVSFDIWPLCDYHVWGEFNGAEINGKGQMYVANVHSLGALPPDSEMEMIDFFEELPNNLTYPEHTDAAFPFVLEESVKLQRLGLINMHNEFFISKVEGAEDLELPKYQTEGSAGADLRANVSETILLLPGELKAIPTGIRISIPNGFEAQIRPRSGLAANYGITTLNSPGTVDSDYRGEIKVILINHSKEVFEITRGLRIAQMVIAKVYQPEFRLVETLDDTVRGAGGFGHTGLTE